MHTHQQPCSPAQYAAPAVTDAIRGVLSSISTAREAISASSETHTQTSRSLAHSFRNVARQSMHMCRQTVMLLGITLDYTVVHACRHLLPLGPCIGVILHAQNIHGITNDPRVVFIATHMPEVEE